MPAPLIAIVMAMEAEAAPLRAAIEAGPVDRPPWAESLPPVVWHAPHAPGGAEVILVEPPDGNPLRRLAPWLADEPGPERSCAHLYFSANKRSVVLDPIADEATFARLVASADVVIVVSSAPTKRSPSRSGSR